MAHVNAQAKTIEGAALMRAKGDYTLDAKTDRIARGCVETTKGDFCFVRLTHGNGERVFLHIHQVQAFDASIPMCTAGAHVEGTLRPGLQGKPAFFSVSYFGDNPPWLAQRSTSDEQPSVHEHTSRARRPHVKKQSAGERWWAGTITKIDTQKRQGACLLDDGSCVFFPPKLVRRLRLGAKESAEGMRVEVRVAHTSQGKKATDVRALSA